jgi:hypothetical protein
VRVRCSSVTKVPARALGLLFFVLAAQFACGADDSTEDHRAWQHGIDLVPVGGKLLVVWGSAGNPPRPNLGGDWPHDVYYAWLNPATIRDASAVEPRILVSRPEAQEPPSTAINSRGTILMSSEDGEDDINQYAGMWDSSLRVLRRYPFTIRRGGHSGHVAAMGGRFLVTYGEGWVERGGFLNRGTGKDIYARIVEDDGTLRKETRIAAGHRDGWPLVAGSDRNWLVIWQRYPELTLHSALIDATGAVKTQREVNNGMPVRYAYDVEYAPQLAAYVVAGSSGDNGFVALLDLTGEVTKIQRGLPPMASESRIVLRWDGAQMIGAYPVRPRGVAVVRLSAGAIELAKLIDHPYAWDYAGTTGVFTAPGQLLFVTLSTSGLQVIPVSLDLH